MGHFRCVNCVFWMLELAQWYNIYSILYFPFSFHFKYSLWPRLSPPRQQSRCFMSASTRFCALGSHDRVGRLFGFQFSHSLGGQLQLWHFALCPLPVCPFSDNFLRLWLFFDVFDDKGLSPLFVFRDEIIWSLALFGVCFVSDFGYRISQISSVVPFPVFVLPIMIGKSPSKAVIRLCLDKLRTFIDNPDQNRKSSTHGLSLHWFPFSLCCSSKSTLVGSPLVLWGSLLVEILRSPTPARQTRYRLAIFLCFSLWRSAFDYERRCALHSFRYATSCLSA